MLGRTNAMNSSKAEGANVWTKGTYDEAIIYSNPSCSLKASSGATKLVLTNCTFNCTRITNYIDFFNGFKTSMYSNKYYFGKLNSKLAWYFESGTMMYVTGINIVSETQCELLLDSAISASASMNIVTYAYSGSKSVPAKKLTLAYVVDDNQSTYPNGAVYTDGYYYELLGSAISTNAMSLSDNTIAAVQSDYRNQIKTEVNA